MLLQLASQPTGRFQRLTCRAVHSRLSVASPETWQKARLQRQRSTTFCFGRVIANVSMTSDVSPFLRARLNEAAGAKAIAELRKIGRVKRYAILLGIGSFDHADDHWSNVGNYPETDARDLGDL
jgi:hypothetical protein